MLQIQTTLNIFTSCNHFQGTDGFSSFLPAPPKTQQQLNKLSQGAGIGHNNQQLNGAASSTNIVTGNQFSSANNVNQFTAQQNRPPRQDQNLVSLRNSGSNSAGQCGKRNAHGINGRVLQDSQFQEGDTEFGKKQGDACIPI